MERHIFRIAETLSLSILLAAFVAHAQSSRPINVRVPFDFVAAERALPAGDYTVTPAFSDHTMLIRSTDSKHALFVITIGAQSPDFQKVPKLIFHRYGKYYFLSEVWTSSTNMGSLLPKPALERMLARGSKKPSQEIAIAGADNRKNGQ